MWVYFPLAFIDIIFKDYHFSWIFDLKTVLHLLCLRLVLDFDLLVYAFGQFPLVVCTWICMFLSVLVVPYTLFHLWSQTQSGSLSHPWLYSLLFGSVFLLYQGLFLGFLPTYVAITNGLPPASSFIIILEQVEQWAAFVRSWLCWKCCWSFSSSFFSNLTNSRCVLWWKHIPL